MSLGRKGVRNLKAVQKALLNQIPKYRKRLRRAVLKGGLLLQRESQQIVPIEFGVLKDSAFTRLVEGDNPDKFDVEVGYEAYYAIYVHEILDNWHAPGKYAKFLEWPLRYMKQEILQVIREEMTE